jgi:hypothetical protein
MRNLALPFVAAAVCGFASPAGASLDNIAAPHALTDETAISPSSSAEVTGDGGQAAVDVAASPIAIPEPSTLAMMGLGFALLAGFGWKAKRRAHAFD